MLGKYGLAAEQLSMQKTAVRRQNYSVSLISAISQHEIVANQLLRAVWTQPCSRTSSSTCF